MKLRRGDFPVVISRLVDGIIALAKSHDLHGRAAVHVIREGDEMFFVISARVPAGETVAARAMAAKR